MKYIILLFVILFSATSFSDVGPNDIQAKFSPNFFQKIFNQLTKSLESKRGYIEKVFPSQTFEINNINFTTGTDLIKQHGKEIFGLNLGKDNSFKVRADVPYIKGKLEVGKPVVTQVSDSVFDVAVELKVHNYYFDIKRLWIQEMNLTAKDVQNEKTCIKELKELEWNKFLSPLKSRSDSFKNSLWARVDNIHLGSTSYAKTFKKTDRPLIVNLEVRFYLNHIKKSFKILKADNNLGQKDGAYLSLHLTKENLVFPPLFIKTLRRKIVNGSYIKDENDNYVTSVVCSPINTDPLGEFLLKYKKQITTELNSKVASLFTNSLVDKINEATKDFRETSIPTNYKVELSSKVIPENVNKAIGNLSELQFDAQKIEVDKSGNILLGIDSEILIDGDYLSTNSYKDFSSKSIKLSDQHLFQNVNEDFAMGISGELFENMISQFAMKFSQREQKLGLKIKTDISNYKVTDDGYIKFTPYLYGTKGNFKVFSLYFNLYVKPVIYENNSGIRKIGYKIKLPKTDTLFSNLKSGRIIKYSNTFSRIVIPFKTWTVDKFSIKKVKSMIEESLQSIRDNFTSSDLSNFIDLSGISPKAITIMKSKHLVMYFDLKEMNILKKYIHNLKEKMGLEE